MRRALLLTVVLLGTLSVPRAGAAPAAEALLRVAHLSPDTPGVDVWVDGQRALGNVGYQTVTDYQHVPAGRHVLELRPAGASGSSPAALRAVATLEAGKAYTAAGLGARDTLRAGLFVDDLSAPAPGMAKVRAINAAVGVSKIDLRDANGPALFSGVSFASAAAYRDVAPSGGSLQLLDATSHRLLATTPTVDFAPGIVYTVAAIGGQGQALRVLAAVDARAAAVAPQGGVQTGGGGTASHPVAPWPMFAAVLALAAFVGTRSRRRRPATVR